MVTSMLPTNQSISQRLKMKYKIMNGPMVKMDKMDESLSIIDGNFYTWNNNKNLFMPHLILYPIAIKIGNLLCRAVSISLSNFLVSKIWLCGGLTEKIVFSSIFITFIIGWFRYCCYFTAFPSQLLQSIIQVIYMIFIDFKELLYSWMY
eukprot:97378_1